MVGRVCYCHAGPVLLPGTKSIVGAELEVCARTDRTTSRAAALGVKGYIADNEGYIGVIQGLCRAYIGVTLGRNYWGYIRIMEKKMEATMRILH